MKTLLLLLILYSSAIVIIGEEADASDFPQPSSKSENEEITEKIKSTSEDFDGSGGFQPMEDISELRNEQAFDEMFSLLRNFLSPYSDVQEKKNDHIKRSIDGVKKNATFELTKHFSSLQQNKRGEIKKINCTHVNSSFKHPDYVQIWFMMHLPKKHKDALQLKNDYNVETWIERLFEQFLHSYDEKEENAEETTAPPTDLIGTHKIVIPPNATEKNQKATTGDPESNESTVDFHMMPETDSTLETTQKFLKNIPVNKERLDTKPVNVWNIKDSTVGKQKKRSVELKKNNDSIVRVERDLLPFVRPYSNFEYNQLRPKRVKRDIKFIQISNKNHKIADNLNNDASDVVRENANNLVLFVNSTSENKQKHDVVDDDDEDDDKNIVLSSKEAVDDDDSSPQKEQRKNVVQDKQQHIGERKQTSYRNKAATKRSSLWFAVTLPTVLCYGVVITALCYLMRPDGGCCNLFLLSTNEENAKEQSNEDN